jgi:hypothetical protein
MKPKPEPAKGEQFIKLPRDLIRSDAWRSASINCRRLLDFLMVEEMASWGWKRPNGTPPVTGNGKLKAPYQQLERLGIAARFISAAICEAEKLGLVRANRQGLRCATMYALTWLPTHDGKGPTNEWEAVPQPGPCAPARTKKSEICPTKGRQGYPTKGRQIARSTLQR